MTGETRLTIVGNLTADPELRYTQNGLAVANFTIANTPREWDRQANEMKDGAPLFLRASVWRDHAEHVASSLRKGMRVIATGQLKQRNYETEQGEKRTAFELEVEEVGPTLRWQTIQVSRTTAAARPGSSPADENAWNAPPADEPWGSADYSGEQPF